jgi:hypothetical protein
MLVGKGFRQRTHLVVRLDFLLDVKSKCPEPESKADQQKLLVVTAHNTREGSPSKKLSFYKFMVLRVRGGSFYGLC